MAAGADFQNRVAAWVAVHILAEKAATSPWDLGAETTLEWMQCQAEQPVDDLLVGTSAKGLVFAQIKRNLTLSDKADSDLAAALDQLVRQLLHHREEKLEPEPFDRPLDPAKDRLVLVTSNASSDAVCSQLRDMLTEVRLLPRGHTLEQADLNHAERRALSIVREHIARSWQNQLGSEPSSGDLREMLSLIHVQRILVENQAVDEITTRNLLRNVILRDSNSADQAWETLVSFCGSLAAQGSAIGRENLQQKLLNLGLQLKAPRSYEEDIARLEESSTALLQVLADLAEICVGSSKVKIQRQATAALRRAAEEGPMLVVGEPGAGKSGVLHDFVETLRSEGRDFVLLAVDRLAARSLGELRNEIGLENDLIRVLSSWPGAQPGFVVIDALDAARAEPAQNMVRDLIAQISREGGRWHVVASIRKFDLRYSDRVKKLFEGPPLTELRDDEFKAVRHLNVPRFSDDELAQIQSQSPELHTLVHSTPAQLRELCRVPFNLRIFAALLGTAPSFSPTFDGTSQLELLDQFWTARVIGTDVNGDAREALLREVSQKMVEDCALRIDRSTIARTDTAAHLRDLLSHQILVEWQRSPGAPPERYTLAFSHHVLFDYAVARLLLRGTAETVVRRLRDNPDFSILVRPSIFLHFRHVWTIDTGHHRFWDLAFRVIESPEVAKIGKLIGPSIAAELARSLTDLESLCVALNDSNVARQAIGTQALRHLLKALLADPEIETRLVGAAAGPWTALLETLSESLREEVAYTLRPPLWALCERYERLALEQKKSAGLTARRLLGFAWSQEVRDGSLVRSALQFVCRTFDSDPRSSAQILRRCLEPPHLSQYGFEEMPCLAREVEGLAEFDPVLVEDIYRTAFGHKETSTDPTMMLSSRILPMTSNRRQDYGMGLYQLTKAFESFLQLAPENATRVLMAAIEAHIAKYRHAGSEVTPAETFDFNGTAVRFHKDLSAIWDQGRSSNHETPVELMEHFQRHLERVADSSDGHAEFNAILTVLLSENCGAALWNRALRAASKRPDTLGRELLPLAWAIPILTCMDTTTSAGDFIRAIFPSLDHDQRERVERAVLSIPDHVPAEHREAGEHARNRLLGCLRDMDLVSRDGRILMEQLLAKANVPANNPVFQIHTSWEPQDEEDHLRTEGVPLEAEASRKIRELEKPIKRFLEQYRRSSPPSEEIEAVFPALCALGNELYQADVSGVDRTLTAYSWDTFATVCALAAGSQALLSGNHSYGFVRSGLLQASFRPEPIYDTRAEGQFDEDVAWVTPAARLEAAQGMMILAQHDALIDHEVLAAIERLSHDPVGAVRFQIAQYASALYQTARELMWTIIERMSAEEKSYGVLQGLVQGTLRRLARGDTDRVAVLTENIYNRIKADPRAQEARGYCAEAFANLALWLGHHMSGQVLLDITSKPVAHSTEILELLGYFRPILKTDSSGSADAASEGRRRHTVSLMCQALGSAQRALGDLQHQFSGLSLDDWPSDKREEAKSLALILETTASEIYHASGAYEASLQKGAPTDPAQALEGAKRFYSETRSLLDLLADSSLASPAHHVVETLEFLVPADPKNIFLCLGRVIRASQGDGYQFESLASDLVVKLVERYLAEYRPILLEDRECRNTLVEILDVFVEAGWPDAWRLCYRLEEIFR